MSIHTFKQKPQLSTFTAENLLEIVIFVLPYYVL